ncbi:hypothetical protein IFM89_039981 [Coptis chinensis]|uniref:Uncharacterized protein n=1 Tax=Coptis chinensis TaxID=261450 RepID=A0A835GVC1_9MAGN|nr:hypothetical protein IFM89_039981 [Coptis chinensis]
MAFSKTLMNNTKLMMGNHHSQLSCPLHTLFISSPQYLHMAPTSNNLHYPFQLHGCSTPPPVFSLLDPAEFVYPTVVYTFVNVSRTNSLDRHVHNGSAWIIAKHNKLVAWSPTRKELVYHKVWKGVHFTASNFTDTSVNRDIIEKLSLKAPSVDAKLRLLKEIAKEYNLDWDASSNRAESRNVESLKRRSKLVLGHPGKAELSVSNHNVGSELMLKGAVQILVMQWKELELPLLHRSRPHRRDEEHELVNVNSGFPRIQESS